MTKADPIARFARDLQKNLRATWESEKLQEIGDMRLSFARDRAAMAGEVERLRSHVLKVNDALAEADDNLKRLLSLEEANRELTIERDRLSAINSRLAENLRLWDATLMKPEAPEKAGE